MKFIFIFIKSKIHQSALWRIVFIPISILAVIFLFSIAGVVTARLGGFEIDFPKRSLTHDGSPKWLLVVATIAISPALETLLFLFLPAKLFSKIFLNHEIYWALIVASVAFLLHGLSSWLWGVLAGFSFFMHALFFNLIHREKGGKISFLYASCLHMAQNSIATVSTIIQG